MKITKLLLFASILLFNIPPIWANQNQAPWIGATLEGTPCHGEKSGYGPFDYSQRATINSYNLEIVESHHFTPKVENLIGGSTASTAEGDIAYTLGAWPNHHRALISIIKYQLKIRSKLSQDKLSLPPECYLQRAINFSQNDAVTYSLYGYYLRKIGRFGDAVKFYEKALSIAPENSKFAYSFSLLLIDLKRYDEAVKYAKIAYQGNGTPGELKRKLQKLGAWRE